MKPFGLAVGAVCAAAIGIVDTAGAVRREQVATSAQAIGDPPAPASPGGSLPTLWDAPVFSYLDQNGRRISNRDLRGHVWIADFFFTRCTSICPMMTARMSALQSSIANRSIRFVSFSVDPDHDTPAVLHEYARMWKADDARWHFLSTDRDRLIETAKGMKVSVRPPEEGGQIPHSGIFTLVDGEGRVRGVYESSDDSALQRLVGDAIALAGTPSGEPPRLAPRWTVAEVIRESGKPGWSLYVSAGCDACHAQARVAPALQGRFGTQVLLDNGRFATFDETYVRESILDPNARVAAGYPRLMPGYRGQLTAAQVDLLVQYIASMEGPMPEPAVQAAPKKAGQEGLVDPVCGMTIVALENPPPVVLHGRTFHFCSETCRAQFVKNPEKFARPERRQTPHGAP